MVVETGATAALVAAGSVGASTAIDSFFQFAQFGLLGFVFLAIVSKHWVVPKWTLDDLEDVHRRELAAKNGVIEAQRLDIQELKDANVELQRLTQDKIIPALVQATGVMQSYVTELARRQNL